MAKATAWNVYLKGRIDCQRIGDSVRFDGKFKVRAPSADVAIGRAIRRAERFEHGKFAFVDHVSAHRRTV